MLARENRLSLVSSEGSVLIYSCSVVGEGSTVWTGTAFDCPSTNDAIILKHNITEYNTTVGTCSNGAIITGRGLSVEGNCFTSQLNIRATADLEGESVICIHRNGSNELIIGCTTIVLNLDTGTL